MQSFESLFASMVEGAKTQGTDLQTLTPPSLPSKNAPRDQLDIAFKKAISTLAQPDAEGSLDEAGISSFVIFFDRLYTDCRYRHMYSDICSVMYGFLERESSLDEKMPPEPLSLANNVEIILRQFKQRGGSEEGENSVRKLRDHVELERTRLEYAFRQNAWQREVIAKANDAVDNAEESLKDTKREYITILGIFASIVITFTAGSAFSASVLQNIDSVGIYRLGLIVLFLGLFLFDLIAILLSFIVRVSKIEEGQTMRTVICLGNGIFAVLILGVVVSRAFNFFG